MLNKTHLTISLFFILIFISSVKYKISFVIVALIATLIPDIDSRFSVFGRVLIFRPFQFFVKHRSFLHSFSFLFLISLFFVVFIPKLSFGFFLGYSLHLFADSFTKEGIAPFYPSKIKSSGFISTGGKIESGIFAVFLILTLAVLIDFLL